MAERDHQHMSSGHRIPVPTGIAERIFLRQSHLKVGNRRDSSRAP
jgi:hypothetical protein